jgi:DNA repair and recombination protein RAD54B
MKPFKPPSFVGALPGRADTASDPSFDLPAAKRRKVGDENAAIAPRDVGSKTATSIHRISHNTPRKSPAINTLNSSENGYVAYYNVLWRKPTTKKHKTWDGDGILRVNAGFAHLRDNESGREMGRAPCNGPLLPESQLSIGGKDVEVESILSRDEYTKLKPVLQERPMQQDRIPPKIVTVALQKLSPKPDLHVKRSTSTAIDHGPVTNSNLNAAPKNSVATQSRFKNPVIDQSSLPQVRRDAPTPRHDPQVEGALVMGRPTTVPQDKQVVDVVVDPILSKHLRDHQREGVKFLYECVMGLRNFDGNGAILADEMGLGKTLQTIALIWTLLKQNPIYGESPVVRKAIVVCPVTLINNWKKEFRKWLGLDRIGVFVADNAKTRITDFTHGKSYSVMIIGYEKMRKLAEDLQKGHGVDLIVADEGHRLKTAQNKSGVALKSLPTARRVILSGTPIQNDLGEFYCMVDFVNPGILGGFKSFTKNFTDPMVRSRQPEATPKEIEKGQGRSDELSETTAPFLLRRTADILSKYLPTKTEYVLMCKPVKAQSMVYRAVLASPVFQSALGNSEHQLQLITILKKVCNSPRLLTLDPTIDPEKNILAAELTSTIPAKLLQNAASTKLRVLDQLLSTLRRDTSEKVVIVSNFTSTLDLLSGLLESLSMRHLRLDGSTPVGKRQELVDLFNRTSSRDYFAFLLSAKAGGMGLNLIGASRLVLFDVDWNPAVDAQAMARIHRDGQKRPCVIYRLLMGGALDEKIWQRQVTKIGLANSVMEQKAGVSSFTRDELRDLFRLDDGAHLCQTHELVGCTCGGRGMPDIETAAVTPPELVAQDVAAAESAENIGELPALGTLVSAAEVDMEAQERVIQDLVKAKRGEKDQFKMQALMGYAHIDTTGFSQCEDEDMDALIHDTVLLDVLKGEENRITFAFARTTGG